jgi:predicted metal-dependent peptidase
MPWYDDDNRIGALNEAYRGLLKARSVILHEALRLGYPRFVNELVNTAAVGEMEDGRIVYYWNRAFFDSLGTDDRVYVCAHEGLHIVLGHPLRRQDRDPETWNVACDIVVNTMLDYGIYLRLPTGSRLSNRWTCEAIGKLPHEVLRMSTEELYDLLAGGTCPGYKPGGRAAVDAHDFWDSLTEEQQERVRDAIGKYLRSRGYGIGSSKEFAQLAKVIVRQFPWQRLLRGRLTTVKRPREGESWVRPNRKIYQHYPNVLLPGIHEGDGATSLVLGSIDTSGSMSEKDIEDCVGIFASLPRDEYEVHATWFDDGVYDAKDLSKAQGRGGTDFQKIEEVCNGTLPIKGENGSEVFLKRYPDVVVALTDGYAGTPKLKHPNRWIWLLTEHGSDSAVKGLGCTVWKIGPA